MAKSKAECTCSICGKVFVVSKFHHKRSQADSFEEWAKETIDTCTDCKYKLKTDEAKNATECLPELTGTDKQVAWAYQLRYKMVLTDQRFRYVFRQIKDGKMEEYMDRIHKVLQEHPDDPNPAAALKIHEILMGTSAKWYIEHQDDPLGEKVTETEIMRTIHRRVPYVQFKEMAAPDYVEIVKGAYNENTKEIDIAIRFLRKGGRDLFAEHCPGQTADAIREKFLAIEDERIIFLSDALQRMVDAGISSKLLLENFSCIEREPYIVEKAEEYEKAERLSVEQLTLIKELHDNYFCLDVNWQFSQVYEKERKAFIVKILKAAELRNSQAAGEKDTPDLELSMEERLMNAGYKVWEKGSMKRIYINDLSPFCEVEKLEADMGRARIINGIDTTGHSRAAQWTADQIAAGDKNIQLYYDCKTEKFTYSSQDFKVCTEIIKSVIKKIREEL